MSVLCFILDNKGYYTAATLVRNQCKELKWL